MNLKMSLFLISKLPIRLGTLGVVRLVGFPNRFFFFDLWSSLGSKIKVNLDFTVHYHFKIMQK